MGLVEAADLASGASSKSSKLIHGGLRYLEMGDIGLVREALAERELLLRVLELVRAGGRVVGAEVLDHETGQTVSVRARHVALAVGAWTDAVRASAGAQFATQIRPSKGMHVVVARERIMMSTGLLVRTEKSVLFVIPTAVGWLIGDTDTPWLHGPDRPVANGADVDYVLAKTNALLADPLTRDDVRGVFAGLRPLVGSASATDTTRLSRRHVVERSMPV